jgi:hypothetical protein
MGVTMPDGETTENVWHVFNTALMWLTPNLTLLADAFVTWLITTVAGYAPIDLIGNDCTVTYITATDITQEPGDQVTVTGPSLPLAGGAATPATVNLLTKAVKQTSGRTGRGQRGRTYWIGVPQGDVLIADTNQMTAAYLAKLAAAMQNLLLTPQNANANWHFGVMNRQLDLVALNPYVVTQLADTEIVLPYFDTQRRRGAGRLASHH